MQPNNQFTDVEALQKALYEQRRENEKLEKINAALMYRMEEGGFNHHSYRAFEHSVVMVKDNGRGLGNHIVENIGMSSMRSRARCIGANCSVTSPDDGGVAVSLSLTLKKMPPLMGANVA